VVANGRSVEKHKGKEIGVKGISLNWEGGVLADKDQPILAKEGGRQKGGKDEGRSKNSNVKLDRPLVYKLSKGGVVNGRTLEGTEINGRPGGECRGLVPTGS